MATPGMSDSEARAFLQRELRRSESLRFYWQSDEVEEAIDLLVDAFAKLVAANNQKFLDEWNRSLRFGP